MRSILIVAALPLIFSSLTYAHGDHAKNGPCKQYFEACQSDDSVKNTTDDTRRDAMSKCVNAAATKDGDKGQACIAAKAKHKGGHKPSASE